MGSVIYLQSTARIREKVWSYSWCTPQWGNGRLMTQFQSSVNYFFLDRMTLVLEHWAMTYEVHFSYAVGARVHFVPSVKLAPKFR